MINENDPIDYRYLNLDTKKFTATQEELTNQLGGGSFLIAIPNVPYGQVLIAGSVESFTQCYAILVCRRLCGVSRVAK